MVLNQSIGCVSVIVWFAKSPGAEGLSAGDPALDRADRLDERRGFGATLVPSAQDSKFSCVLNGAASDAGDPRRDFEMDVNVAIYT